jgi:proteasome lid subunit RPN8/RPN11
MEPHELLRALILLENRRWDLLAVYHSHPPGARTDPSENDLVHASYPGCGQVIIVPGHPGIPPSVRAFDVVGTQVEEVGVLISDIGPTVE